MSVEPLDRGLPSAVYATEAGFSLQERLSVLSRYRYVAGTTFLLVLIIAAFQIYTAIPMYRATIQLRIQDERTTRVVGIEADDSFYWTDPEPYYQTQYLIIRGSGLARRVIQRPELASAAELSGEGPQGPSLIAAVRSIGTWLTDFPLFGKDAPVEPSAPDETDLESVLMSNFVSRVEVVPVRNTQLVDVSFVAADPELAATAVNALAEEYVQQNLDVRLDAVFKTLDWLGTEITRQQSVVEHSERALGDYRESQNALSLGDQQNIVVSRLNALNDEATRARTNRLQKQTQYQQLQALGDLDTLTDTLPSTVATPTVQLANARMNELRRERNLLVERYGDRHPEMVRVTAELQDANAQLRIEVQRATEAIRTEYEAAVIEERNLVAALETQKTASMDLDRKSVDYTILEREAQSNRQVYEQLLQRENELQVASNSNTNNVQVVDLAEVPAGPFSPNPVRDFLLATVIGLALGIGLAFGLDHMDDTVKTPEDVTTSLRLPFLGLVPAVKSNSPPLLSMGQGEPVPHDFGEAFRAIRTSLVFTSSTASTRIVLVTSAQPFEGKTTTSCNLAMALALSDARVLLIEGDMRRPGLHKNFGLQNRVGLSHLLTNQARIRDAIQRTSDLNLFVITAGHVPPNPSELLASDRMKDLLKNLESSPFDWVIVDSPPVLPVTDAVVLAPYVSGIVFVLGSRMTQKRQAVRAVEMLTAASPHAIGVVLNRVDLNRDRYYYSHYYGYQNTSYYGSAVAS